MNDLRAKPARARSYLALSLAQRAIWTDLRRLDDARAYQVGAIFTLRAAVDADLARQALRILMGRHESMRLRVDAFEPRQWVETGGPTPFRFTDFASEPDPQAAAAARFEAVLGEGFALGEGPLFRVELARLGAAEHRMLLVCHHLAFDGVSLALLQREWLSAYRTLAGDEAETANPARSTYAGVVEADEAYALSPRYEEDIAYWRDRLASPPQAVFAASPLAADDAAAHAMTFDATALQRLEAAAGAAGSTLHQALVALFGVALARRYGREDLILGMALHRRDAASRNVIGCLAGLMPVRCRFAAAEPLPRALGRIAQDMTADLRHARAPADAIAREIAAEREGLFDAAVTVMPSFSDAAPSFGGQPVTSMRPDLDERSPLGLYINELPGRAGLAVELRRRRGQVSAREAGRVLEIWRGLVEAFAAGEAPRFGAIGALAAEERASLAGWSRGAAIEVPQSDAASLFEAVARRQPEALAVVADEGRLSFAELDAAADRIAARLVAEGVQPGEAVGVAIPRSLASPAALLGVLKAGAVYLPLDPDHPADRIAGMIADAGARFVLALPGVDFGGVTAIRFAEGWPLAGERLAAPVVARDPGARAYIVFTSGSTGRPKGVAVSHRALVNLAYARLAHDPLRAGDRVLAAISIGFDVSLGQLLTPLLMGATVAVAGDIRGLSADGFWSFLARHEVSHINSVPSFFASVLDAAPERTTLKRLMLGGEPLSGALAARLRERLGAPVVNMYGPTEACIDATCYPVPEAGAEGVAVLPIGRPLPNYSVHVLDAALKPCAIGVEGELCIGGPSLAEGYVGLAELTAERFVETAEYGRLYRTGDRVAWDEEGQIRFLGRADAQVKIRGHRVELGEIEAALRGTPGVAQAAVIARPDPRGQMRLLGYWVGETQAEALRAALKRALPSYMVPAALIRLDALPLTINGKLDERALPEPAAEAETLTPPQGPTELWLAEAFAELFPGQPIGRESHFFDLGGHSLMATQLATRLRAARGLELPLRVLFEEPRLEDLARAVDALSPAVTGPALTPRPRPERLPLSPAQERLWFIAQMDAASAAYNIPVALKIEGRLDAEALRRALKRLTDRHESLRTRFLSAAGLPYQDILPERAPALGVIEVPGEAGLRAAIEREALKPFDLERDCLVRAALMRGESDVLVLTIHHIVADGASMYVVLPELAAFYADEAAALPPLPVQFADYALWRRDPAFADAEKASLAFWRETLQGAPEALTLPTDFPRPERATGRGDSVALDLGPELSDAVRRFARERRATPFAVLAAAWSALLARWSGQDEVVIGAPLANRGAPETQGMVAFLVNTIALRARLDDAPDFATLVDRLREATVAAHEHGDMPFERVVAALAPERSLARNPVFQAMFALQPAAPGSLNFGAARAEPVPMLEKVAKFDLTLNLAETANGFDGALTYATDLFAPETVARMAGQLRAMLAAALADPAMRCDRLPLVGTQERAALASVALGPRRALSPAKIPALFAARVAAQPQAEAVAFGARRLTYAELDAQTNRLARALIAAGVKPGRPVAVMLQRCEALVVAALGVMKAGAVYMPVDPAAPDARVGAMLADAAPALFLCDATTRERAQGLASLDIAEVAECASAPPVAALTPEATAYLIYTSGSTGTPKGVAVSHAALATLADARLAHDPIGPGDRVLATMSVGFDVSVGQLVTPLLSGAAVVVAPALSGVSGAEFWALMAEQKITHVNSGPAFLDAVMETPPPSDLPLKRLMLGGEAFPTALARRIAAALPNVEIFNMYGPTEACIDATAYRFRGDETAATLPIGRALPNYRVAVLDPDLNPVPPGVAGEICIGGPSLAQGYLNRPEETAARFVRDSEGVRLYRTGDRARLNAQGEIEFLGRLDAQVKIRGHRIEPDEIAAVLRREPTVAQAAVAAHKRGRETCLVAYFVAAPGAAPTPAQLRARAEAALPGYMVPAAYVACDALPMTINGKLDLKALPAPDFAEEASEPQPPRDERDAALVEIWRDLLESERIGIDDNFFRLGGHSLLALRLVAAVKAKLQLELPIAAVYRYQTIRALSDAIQSGEAVKRRGPLIKLGDGPGLPVFAFHPVGGGAFGFIGMAEALEGKRPVYGVQASGLEAGETLAADLDEMMGDYLAAIRAVQPRGPYAFIGHSFGGLAAFEIARRLEEMGETVDRLVLSDTSPAGEPWTMELAERTAKRIVQLERERSGRTAEPIDEAQQQRVIDIVANNMRLSESYAPPRIRTPLIYLLARRGDAPMDGRRAYWEARSENPVPWPPNEVDHLAVLNRDNARKLAVFFV